MADYLINNFPEKTIFLYWGGVFISISTIIFSFLFGKILEIIFFKSNGNFIFGLTIFFGLSSCFATKSLISSVKEVSNSISSQQKNNCSREEIVSKVQRIVSRDVSSSSLEHLLRSATESLTENSIDGIFAPLFWIFTGVIIIKNSIYLPGPLYLGFSYKAISTLDSMIGYKHGHFKYLGYFSAKIEDFATYIPCRITALTLPLITKKVKNYFFVIKKSFHEGNQYDSPNSGISEAIYANIVNIRLGGESVYNNKPVFKPIINSVGNKPSGESVNRICNLILRLQLLWIFIFSLLFFLLI